MKSGSGSPAAEGSHENWIPLLDMAAREVFDLMLSCQLTVPATTEEATLDVTAMVGLAGQLCGVLSVRCSGKAAALMTSKMLGVELNKVGPQVADALGEVCNMVAGNFKSKISTLADRCLLSVPTVITGGDYSMETSAPTQCIIVPLLFEGQPIWVALIIHR